MTRTGLNIAWSDALAVGDPQIDEQHRSFFDDVSAVLAAMERGEGRETVQRFHCDFILGLARHFRDEELLLASVDYPDLDHHRAEHRALMSSVSALGEILADCDNYDGLRSIVRNTITALIEHMALEDMRYRRYVKEARAERW